jgi:hypothetical protein
MKRANAAKKLAPSLSLLRVRDTTMIVREHQAQSKLPRPSTGSDSWEIADKDDRALPITIMLEAR